MLELNNDEIFLSDNSLVRDGYYQPSDLDFLNNLLMHEGLGQMIDYKVKLSHQEFKINSWVNIFMIGSGMEALSYTYWNTWRYFRNREHGFKLPTALLDPLIAYLIKAISSIGVNTFQSCDGHAEKEAYVGFCGKFNHEWFKNIVQNLVRRNIMLVSSWSFDETKNGLVVIPQNSDYVAFYKEIYVVAGFLYKYRIYLRELKTRFCQECQKDEESVIMDKMASFLSDNLTHF